MAEQLPQVTDCEAQGAVPAAIEPEHALPGMRTNLSAVPSHLNDADPVLPLVEETDWVTLFACGPIAAVHVLPADHVTVLAVHWLL